MEAVEECLPPGVVRVCSQPAPERIPLDHEVRCDSSERAPEGWKRADIAVDFVTGRTIVLDVRTTNTLASSAGRPSTHLHALEAAKSAKYAGYYRDFMPYVVDLGGAVSEQSFGALRSIAKEAAKAARPRLTWEAADWTVRMQRRIAVAMAKCTAWIVTRVRPGAASPGCRAGLGRQGGCLAAPPPPAEALATAVRCV